MQARTWVTYLPVYQVQTPLYPLPQGEGKDIVGLMQNPVIVFVVKDGNYFMLSVTNTITLCTGEIRRSKLVRYGIYEPGDLVPGRNTPLLEA